MHVHARRSWDASGQLVGCIVALGLSLSSCSRGERGSRDSDSAPPAPSQATKQGTAAAYVRTCPPTLPDPPIERAVFDVHVRTAEDDREARVDSLVRVIEGVGG